ncbi:MAG: hypothetical protein F7B60_06295 [Desulfurococcales archaeon]|nr:hypothetical protein [Desulfurococcales archaeon]
MNVAHAAIVIVGLVLLAMITTPLALLIKEALENPTILNASVQEENDMFVVLLTYNGSIKLTDVNFTTILGSNDHVFKKSATASVLTRNSTLILTFPKNETNGTSKPTLREMILSGKVDGLYPFRITYKPEGG